MQQKNFQVSSISIENVEMSGLIPGAKHKNGMVSARSGQKRWQDNHTDIY